jgi:regulator of RNase E activity RraA
MISSEEWTQWTDTAIRCGIGVTPGDLIFADLERAVTVPQELAEEAMHKAW